MKSLLFAQKNPNRWEQWKEEEWERFAIAVENIHVDNIGLGFDSYTNAVTFISMGFARISISNDRL